MRNTLKPTSAMITEIQKHAIKAFPHEACGVIVKKGKSKMQVVSCRNIAEMPEHFFVCHPDDLAGSLARTTAAVKKAFGWTLVQEVE